MSFLDRVATAFKGSGNNRVPLRHGYNSPWALAFERNSRRPRLDYAESVRRGFLTNPIVQRAVRIVAEGVGQMPFVASDARATDLLAATSAGQSLIETLGTNMLLHGNGYVQIIKDGAGQPVELFALRPDRVTLVPDEHGWPAAYDYKVGERTIRLPADDENRWPNIIHIKAMHPIDDHYGAGPLAAAEQAIAIHNAASEWNRSLLENAARPSGALVYDAGDGSGLTSDQFERLKSELTQAFAGHDNAGRPMLLDGGLKWQSMALSPADMDFAELKSAAARDIALAFGVPPMLLGLPGDNTYSNYREANRALWRLTLLPLASKLFAAIEEGLSPWIDELSITVDLDQIPALSEDRERLWKQVSDAEFLSDNEKRAMLGIATPEAST
ncbi:uncharacterized protein BPTFM16_01947 [Altererythrobacter insulae]|nr:uncharacterized protein BPTFM16_01947 [Altererythrobacter insulae]